VPKTPNALKKVQLIQTPVIQHHAPELKTPSPNPWARKRLLTPTPAKTLVQETVVEEEDPIVEMDWSQVEVEGPATETAIGKF